MQLFRKGMFQELVCKIASGPLLNVAEPDKQSFRCLAKRQRLAQQLGGGVQFFSNIIAKRSWPECPLRANSGSSTI
jgi:hypothetical protein